MKKFKAILSSAKERERADRDNTRQHLGFAGTSGSSGNGPSWSQTPNVAPPSLPGPQPQPPLNNNAPLGTFPSAMMRALPGPNTAAQIPARPINAPSFPQQPQQYEIPSENGIQTVPSHKNSRFCRWCDRCKSGIPYGKDSYICLECKYWLCRGCRYVHTTLHPQRIKVEMRQWINFSNEYAPVSTCSQCSTVKMARLQCTSNNCSYSLCVACFHVGIYLDKFLKEHIEKEPTHQDFLAIYPDEWRVRETWRKSLCVCYEEKPVGKHPAWATHCEKCHDPIEIDCSVYWCRDCRQIWGFGQWICEPCFLETDEDNMQHKQKHYFIKALIKEDPNLPDTHKERFYCPICRQCKCCRNVEKPLRRLKETDYVSHKHDTGSYSGAMSIHRNPDLYFMLSPRQKDWQRLNMYRSCDKELVAKNSSQYPDEMGGTAISKCMMCQFLLAYNQPATLCVKGNCNHCIYCASCTNSKRIDHRHKDSTYAVKLIRKTNLPVTPLSPVQCAKCRKKWFKTHFKGLFCNQCKYFAICWGCIAAASKGPSFELISGLPHQTTAGSSKTCTASDWLLIYEPAQGVT